MTQTQSNPVFAMRFVATEKGVKAEQRVKGRIAFPSNRGPQPAAGETWKVKIAGENPKKTVYFLTCIEKVEQPQQKIENVDAPSLNSPAGQKFRSDVQKSVGRFKDERKGKGGDKRRRNDDGKSNEQNQAPRVWSFGSTSEAAPRGDQMFVEGYLFAPGTDAYEQAKAWLTPVTQIDLSNLKLAHAQKAAAADNEACAQALEMATLIGLIDEGRGQVEALTAQLKGYGKTIIEPAQECIAAKKRLVAATAARSQLQLDTLSYGRLKQSYVRQGKADDAEANAHLAVIKGDLDVRRTAVNDEFTAAKNAASDAEMSKLFSCDSDIVDQAIAMINDREMCQTAIAANMAELKTKVCSYEDRVHQLRKPS